MFNKIIFLFITIIFIGVAQITFAITCPSGSGQVDCSGICQPAPCKTSEVKLDNPLGKDNPTPQVLIGKVLNAVLGIVGSLALLMFIYGGFTWMLAGGNAEAVTKGKNILIWATIGLIVIFSAYALVRFVFQGVGVTP